MNSIVSIKCCPFFPGHFYIMWSVLLMMFSIDFGANLGQYREKRLTKHWVMISINSEYEVHWQHLLDFGVVLIKLHRWYRCETITNQCSVQLFGTLRCSLFSASLFLVWRKILLGLQNLIGSNRINFSLFIFDAAYI